MINFSKQLGQLRKQGQEIKPIGIDFSHNFGTIDECGLIIKKGFEYFEPGINFRWIPEYAKIAEYLSDTNNKGLVLIGNSGRGKTLFLTKIFPLLISTKTGTSVFYDPVFDKHGKLIERNRVAHKHKLQIKVFDAKQPWGKFTRRIIDEVGREAQPIKGEIDVFPAFIDWCEKNNHPIFLTANMNGNQLKTRYGDWVISRMKKLATVIVFEGEDMRGK